MANVVVIKMITFTQCFHKCSLELDVKDATDLRDAFHFAFIMSA